MVRTVKPRPVSEIPAPVSEIPPPTKRRITPQIAVTMPQTSIDIADRLAAKYHHGNRSGYIEALILEAEKKDQLEEKEAKIRELEAALAEAQAAPKQDSAHPVGRSGVWTKRSRSSR